MHAIVAVALMSFLCVAPSGGRLHEPECSSFTVMEKLLEKMVRVEFNLQTVQASMLQWEAKMEALLAKAAVSMDAWQTRLDAAETSLQTRLDAAESGLQTQSAAMETSLQIRLDAAMETGLQTQSAAMETSLKTRLDAAMETGLQTQSAAMGKQLEEALHKHKHELRAIATKTTETLEAAEQRLEKKEADVTSQLAAALIKNQEDLQTFQEAYQTPIVLFTARDTDSADVIKGVTIIFTNEQFNLGDGYDRSTGVFTAPHSGSYFLTTNVCSLKNKRVTVHLVAAGTVIAGTEKYNADWSGSCTSISGVAVLREGDTVSVQGPTTQTGAMYQGGSLVWPSFAGMLVHKA